jgi:hypothetical protein
MKRAMAFKQNSGCFILILRSEPQVRVSKDASFAHPLRRQLRLLRMRTENA